MASEAIWLYFFSFFYPLKITILKEKSALEKIIWKATIFQHKYRYRVAKAHLCNFFSGGQKVTEDL